MAAVRVTGPELVPVHDLGCRRAGVAYRVRDLLDGDADDGSKAVTGGDVDTIPPTAGCIARP